MSNRSAWIAAAVAGFEPLHHRLLLQSKWRGSAISRYDGPSGGERRLRALIAGVPDQSIRPRKRPFVQPWSAAIPLDRAGNPRGCLLAGRRDGSLEAAPSTFRLDATV